MSDFFTPIDYDIFSISITQGVEDAFVSLTLSTDDRIKAGNYTFAIIERSDFDATITHTSLLTFMIEDYCLGAELSLSQASEERKYIAG